MPPVTYEVRQVADLVCLCVQCSHDDYRLLHSYPLEKAFTQDLGCTSSIGLELRPPCAGVCSVPERLQCCQHHEPFRDSLLEKR